MQAKSEAVMQNEGTAAAGPSSGTRLWMACAGLLSALLALPFLASGLLDLGDESLTDLAIGLAACWFAARLLLKAGWPLRQRRSRPAMGLATR
ncbi:hypothetical protein D0B54_15905 [Solimonas sp. K1W22B-7]|uniref:hypothetical protein n=1 Tax=Solimonas sp. K1W22B-7 TaxID=2303331 RepID=UPI000E336315|nr:hypothetical protein [Solimonas sp. K1W22B-7]AXQ30063.1 hypothetical protein D0B54_15905 [Solimonas sp. K1W22B-7]